MPFKKEPFFEHYKKLFLVKQNQAILQEQTEITEKNEAPRLPHSVTSVSSCKIPVPTINDSFLSRNYAEETRAKAHRRQEIQVKEELLCWQSPLPIGECLPISQKIFIPFPSAPLRLCVKIPLHCSGFAGATLCKEYTRHIFLANGASKCHKLTIS